MNHLRAQWRQAARTYYHASPNRLPVGTMLTPRGGRANFGGNADSDYVYLTSDEGYAEQWGNAMAQDHYVPRIYIYEVEPHGEVIEGKAGITDPTGFYDEVQELRAESAVVKRLVYSFDTETGEAKYAKVAARWVYDVEWARDKDTLMAGEVVGGISRVFVSADSEFEARLIAEQMVAAGGHEPTRATMVEEGYAE